MIYKNGDICPICGEGTIKVKRKPETFEYKGQTLTLKLIVYSCDVCGEEFFDNEEMKKHQKNIKDFQRRVDGLLTSEEIKRIREKYGLSQRELARILGIAEKSIAKYEAGFVSQSKAMDNLLRIIGKFPDVLEYLMQTNQVRKNERKVKSNIIPFEDAYRIKTKKKYREEKPVAEVTDEDKIQFA